MEASVGMNRSSLGQQSNAVSGRAKLADKQEGDTANFHYLDNRNRSIEQLGRVILGMIPEVYTTRRQAQILGDDDKQSEVTIDPTMEEASRKKGKKVVAINPGVGHYDARVKVGPSFTSQREEASQRLTELADGNPALGAALAPLIIAMHDIPEAEKIAKVAIALLPPNVQQVYAQEEEDDIPPAIKQQMAGQAEQIQKMAAAMDQAGKVIQDLQGQVNDKNTQVQDQVKIAIAEIKTAKGDLDAQGQELDHKKALLNSSVRIAQLELQLAALKNQTALEDQILAVKGEFEVAMKDREDAAEEPKEDPMAKVLAKSQEMMAKAMENSTKTLAKLQTLTVDALEDMADAIAAPRDVQIQRGKDGKATGAKSIAVMPAEQKD
jgi:hypothetical protein